MAKTIDIEVPDLGDFSDVEIIEVLVSPGDRVEKEDGLITLETDKAAMDVPAPEDGVIEEITVSTGDTVSSGDVIGKLSLGEGDGDGEGDDGSADKSGESDGTDDDGDDDDRRSDEDTSSKASRDKDGSGEDDDEKGETRTLKVPDIGDFDEVEVIEVHVSDGDSIEAEDALVTLESDKAAMDVPAEVGGKIEKVFVGEGDKVSEGTDLVRIVTSDSTDDSSAQKEPAEAGDAGKKDADRKDAKAQQRAEDKAPSGDGKEKQARAGGQARRASASGGKAELPPINEAGFAKAHASPSVRKLARELGVDLTQVKGSGPKQRVLHDDVKAWVKSVLSDGGPAGAAVLPETPKVDFAKFGEVETKPLTRIQKIAGPRLQASWINLPHVTQHDEADITELEARRQELKGPAKERNISLTPLAFIVKATIAALKEFPKVNASLSADGDEIVFKHYYHIGFAADTEQGLMVPVIRDADKLDVYEIATALMDLSSRAREGKLKSDDLQGASFTISSLGGIGGTAFTPIVNAPEVAILGVSRSTMKPVWNGDEFEPRLMLPLSLSYDHRVIDGADAVRFTTFLGETLGNVDGLVRAEP